MKITTFLLVLALAGIAGWYLSEHIDEVLPVVEQVVVAPARQAPIEKPANEPAHLPIPARHPLAPLANNVAIAQSEEAPSLPLPEKLEQADPFLREELGQLIKDKDVFVLLNLNYFIQKLVLFIDHLPEKTLPRLYLPLLPPESEFITQGEGEERLLAPENASRYENYVRLLEAIPDARLVKLYRGLYPLFQQAYRESGNENGYFNDRLIVAFDDLLQTPEPSAPLKLVSHIRRFRYADPDLEDRSAGQKILLRMGVENTRRVKLKLQGLREKLARQDW